MIYEDYFKSIVGGNLNPSEYYAPTYTNRSYEPRQVNSTPGYTYSSTNNNLNNDEIKKFYPDIYNVVTPMVEKILSLNDTNDINENMLQRLVVEIYDALEVDDYTLKNVNNADVKTQNNNNSINDIKITKNNNVSNINNITNISNVNNIKNQNISNNNTKTTKDINNTNINITDNNVNYEKNIFLRYRNYKNPLLRDLIRIIILDNIQKNEKQEYSLNQLLMPTIYKDANVETYKPYTNYSKTYFDIPYPEEK